MVSLLHLTKTRAQIYCGCSNFVHRATKKATQICVDAESLCIFLILKRSWQDSPFQKWSKKSTQVEILWNNCDITIACLCNKSVLLILKISFFDDNIEVWIKLTVLYATLFCCTLIFCYVTCTLFCGVQQDRLNRRTDIWPGMCYRLSRHLSTISPSRNYVHIRLTMIKVICNNKFYCKNS